MKLRIGYRAFTQPFAMLALSLAVLGIAAPLAAAQIAAEQQSGVVAFVTAEKLNVRSGPAAGFPVVAVLGNGVQVEVTGRNSDASWVRIRAVGAPEGWSSTLYLSQGISYAQVPVIAVQTEEGTQTFVPQAFVTTSFANIRTGPSVGYSIVEVLPYNTGMNLIGRNVDGVWVKVRLESGREGWISTTVIQANVAIFSLPVGTVDVNEPAPTVVPPVGPSNSPLPVPLNPSGNTAIVIAESLNVRGSPSIGSFVVATVQLYNPVIMLARTGDNSWTRIRMSTGQEGWVSSVFLSFNPTDFANLPVEGVSEPFGVVTTGSLNVRTGPAPTFNIVQTVQAGNTFLLIGRNADGSWLKVKLASASEGWASSLYITTSVPIFSLPVTQ